MHKMYVGFQLFYLEGEAMNYWENIGANIRTLRKNRGLTIEDLAFVLDIAPGFLGLVERGTRGVSISNLNKICRFFDVTLDELIRGKVETKLYVADENSLKTKVMDLAFSMSEDELKVVISNIKKVMAINHK